MKKIQGSLIGKIKRRYSRVIILLITCILYGIFYTSVDASINLTVSPTKYEIEALTGTIITRKATLYNYSKDTYTITTGKADFITNGNTGIPKIIPNNPNPDQQLSSWINIETLSFIIAPGEKKDIQFTINIPNNASPGGHYGVVFFKKSSDKNNNNSSNIGVNIDYGILILVNVDGKIIMKGTPQQIVISGGGRGLSIINGGAKSSRYYLNNNSPEKKSKLYKSDNCLIYDFTNSNFDGKCISSPFNNKSSNNNNSDNISKLTIKSNSINNPTNYKNTKSKNNSNLNNTIDLSNKSKSNKNTKKNKFNISFNLPFKNEGNTHIKPIGKITLIDQDGNKLKGIGQEIIKNKRGAVIGEKIVDYLPINDVGGNVLPYSTRDFKLAWKGFSYKTYDEDGNEIIKYWNPTEYYTKQNINARGFIMFWERYSERINHKKITALIDLAYKNKKGKKIEFNSAKEFNIDYKESYIGYNPYVILIMIIIGIVILIIYIISKLNETRCRKCDKKIKKNAKACPNCGKKVKNKDNKNKK